MIKDLRVSAGFGLHISSSVIAHRGERLALIRTCYTGRDERPEAFAIETLHVIGIDVEERISALITFEVDAFDAAFAELDARYLAGEAAAHSRTWSAINDGFTALNRHELPAISSDFVDVDHRRGVAFAPGELMRYLRAGWEVNRETRSYVEAVHRLNDLGALVTHTAQLTSREGFDADWRTIEIFTVEGDLVNRVEIFDEADLDAALAQFERLSHRVLRLENVASQVFDRVRASFAARDWKVMAELFADDLITHDRRLVVGAGVRHGRDAELESMRAVAEVGAKSMTSTAIAVRGERLVMGRDAFLGDDQGVEPFRSEVLAVIETNAHNRVAAITVFDVDHIDAAFEELDARYLAGEAAAHAHTWSVAASAYAAIDRHELPRTTPDWVNVDHRMVHPAMDADSRTAHVRAGWDLAPNFRIYIEAVHRLSSSGAVVTHAAHGTSPAGLDAEWHDISLVIVAEDGIRRCELFDEADLDAALARFDELDRQTPGIDDAPEQIWVRLADAYNRRDTDVFNALASADGTFDDRRKGFYFVEDGPARLQNLRAILDISPSGWRMEVKPIAIRGSFLSLIRLRWVDIEDANQAITVEALTIIEVTEGGLIRDTVTFDTGDIGGAVAELDARYLAGEAAPHAHSWSLVAGAFATLNARQLLATTPDCVSIDNRPGRAYEGDMIPYVNAMWEVAPDIMMCIEVVHRLTSRGALVTWASYGTSQEGFSFESRGVSILMLEGDLIAHGEILDEEHLDAALVTFEELNRGR